MVGRRLKSGDRRRKRKGRGFGSEQVGSAAYFSTGFSVD